MSAGRELASHFQNATAFGQLAPLRSRQVQEDEREKWIPGQKQGRRQELFNGRQLITVCTPSGVGTVYDESRYTQLHTHLWLAAFLAVCGGAEV